MNIVFSIAISLVLSLSLLGVELISTYHIANDIIIELVDTNEENSTEDNKDTKLDLEINLIEANSFSKFQLTPNLEPTIDQSRLLSTHYLDISIPPPDFT